ncbi:bifunctional diguanylate cyclase/phosphodiesterase [Hydrogenimonas urashimensis]|uniref:bifunctional diguanylate cyclase/phosphodiesterase n=1 Tax=Hydrogenimonas urashimensis TaxID=2740515 RepID=UPI001916AF41|nr:LapD/MoxY N-terminal periplasmic domain-containing protein [Hydrogenimonas urashimensis]
MSLTKQIGIVVSLLLLFLLGSVLGIYFVKSKGFFEEQLAADAKSAAHALTRSLKPVIDDEKEMKTVVDALFGSGKFGLIELKDMQNATLYKRIKRADLKEVPEWFVELVQIKAPIATDVLEEDHSKFLNLLVQADRSAAYRELYGLFFYTIALFVIFGILGLLLLNLVLRVVLRSLENIKNQAEGVIHNRFIIQKEIPSTVELKNVVLAMNSMVKRVKELYVRSSEAMKESQEMLYLDQATDLFNRRYFQLKLPEYLMANDTRSRGSLMMIRMNGVVEGNRKIGHKKMDELLLEFAKILKQESELVHEPLICRINGTEFALLLPVYNAQTAKDLAKSIIGKHMLLCERYGLRNLLTLSVGICEYVRKMPMSKLLSCVDSALTDAAMYNEDRIVVFESDENRPAAGKTEWREIITKALREGHLKPVMTPVVDLKQQKEASHILSFDIIHEGRTIRYGEYVPAVVELGLEQDLLNFEFDYMKKHRFKEETIAFEMIADMLQESDKLFIFEDTVKEIAENHRGKLYVEISEHDILALEPIVVEHVSMTLKEYGVRFGISRFSAERGEYSYLKYSAPAYVKMSENSFLDLDTASKNALLTLLGSLDIELIITGVHEENLSKLQAASIRYIVYA